MDNCVLLGIGICATVISVCFAVSALAAFFDDLPIRMWVDACKFSKRVKVGDVYYYEESDYDNPFEPVFHRKVKILGVKKNKKGMVWVEYSEDDSKETIRESAFDLYHYKLSDKYEEKELFTREEILEEYKK